MIVRNYELVKKLGEGSNGVAYLARELNKNMDLVVKIINIKLAEENGIEMSEINDEIQTLIDLSGRSKYIVTYYDNFDDMFNGAMCKFIVTEYVRGSELGTLVGDNLPPSVLWPIILQLLLGLKAIHDADYAHGDITFGNIMITDDLCIKYIDFGLSCIKKCQTYNCTNQCNKKWPNLTTYSDSVALQELQNLDIKELAYMIVKIFNSSSLYDKTEIPNYQLDDGTTNIFLLYLLTIEYDDKLYIGTILNHFIETVMTEPWIML